MSHSLDFRIRRTLLGLEIDLAGNPDGASALQPQVFVDEVFRCGRADAEALTAYVKERRTDIVARLRSGANVRLFVPEGDPHVARIDNREARPAGFTLGELTRWRFLKRRPDYPFKPHQRDGVAWLCGRTGAILADDMGLGKTLQAIAALERLLHTGDIHNALIVCPKSLIGVWETEIRLWAPRLCTAALYSSISEGAWRAISPTCHVAIANYETLRRAQPAPGAFDLVIFDEVHKLKNPSSLNYRLAYELKPARTWGLSGTPLENAPRELVAILHLLDRKRVAHSDSQLPAGSLRAFASRYVLRRDKAVLGTELPEVLERTEAVPLSSGQRRAYRDLLRTSSCKTMGQWLSAFNALRSICDFDPETKESSKIDRVLAILEAVRRRGEKAIVFSWRLEPLRLLRGRLSEALDERAVATITGQTGSTARTGIVDSFQTAAEPSVLLCSTRATAEGLTLTAANHVIFLNEWWNPAVNAQARDRVNRIGQQRDVFVHRLRAEGTVESRLDEILRTKAALFEEIVGRMSVSADSREAVPRTLRGLLDGEDA